MKETIRNILVNHSSRALFGILKREHSEIYNTIRSNAKVPGFAEQLYWFMHDLEDFLTCPQCQQNKITSFISFKDGYKHTCSKECGMQWMMGTTVKKYNEENGTNYTNLSQFPETRMKLTEEMKNRDFVQVTLKYKKRMLERYGVDNGFKAEEVKNKIKKTCLEKYGTENPMFNPEIAEKNRNATQETMMEKYGVKWPAQVPHFNKKYKMTSLSNYGETHYSKNEEVKENRKTLLFAKYGVNCIFQLEEVKQKTKQTFLEKYNVENPMHYPEFADKHFRNSVRLKEFKWKTGEISLVQGYENQILLDLENTGYNFEEIITSRINIPEFFYRFEGKIKRYYPDIYIPNENLIIEVKSNYTLNCDYEKNQAKFQAVKDAGYDFRLEIR